MKINAFLIMNWVKEFLNVPCMENGKGKGWCPAAAAAAVAA